MKFALLGSDVESMALSEAALAAGHDLIWVGDIQTTTLAGEPKQDSLPPWLVACREQNADGLSVGLFSTEPHTGSPAHGRKPADWQVLLDRQTVDVVIVGRGQARPEVRAEQLGSLARQGITVLSTHRSCLRC